MTALSDVITELLEARQAAKLLMYALDQLQELSPDLFAALEISEDAVDNRDCASCYWSMKERHEFPCRECRDGMNWTKKTMPDNGVEP